MTSYIDRYVCWATSLVMIINSSWFTRLSFPYLFILSVLMIIYRLLSRIILVRIFWIVTILHDMYYVYAFSSLPILSNPIICCLLRIKLSYIQPLTDSLNVILKHFYYYMSTIKFGETVLSLSQPPVCDESTMCIH